MATEVAANTNGAYNYQGQDISGANHDSSASQSGSTSTSAAATKPDALEIGWYFVEQYYTTLSKNPERIHLFYSKKSQLVTGKEAEKVLPSVGQKAISDKIKELEFKDCKVRVLNVDSQASFQNIVVQVIGEMSNNSQPHAKFVQTFVLAEQPNGYFVLNDIFRYIDVGEEELEAEEEETPAPEVASEQIQEPAPEPTLESERGSESVVDKAGTEELEQKLEGIALEADEAEPSAPNGADRSEEELEEPVETGSEAQVPSAEPSVPVTENPPEPEPSRSATPPKEPAPAPVPETAPVKKTWAHMVGSKSAVTPVTPAQPNSVQPAASKPAPASTPAPTASQSTNSGADASSTGPTQGNGWQTADHGKKQNRAQTKTDQVILGYVKNVTDKVDARLLRQTLESFGELKYFDVSRPKNCAFVEFANADGYNAAAAANPHVINGEQIIVEERRPRPAQFGNASAGQYNRGNAPAGRGGSRGGFQGRSGSQSGGFPKDAGRGGGFQGRGGNKGNVTPKGRGQVQAA